MLSCVYQSLYGGVMVIATPDKEYWKAYVAAHASPEMVIYVKTPIVDSSTGCTCLLVDSKLRLRKVMRNWLKRCYAAPKNLKSLPVDNPDSDAEGQIPRSEVLDVPY